MSLFVFLHSAANHVLDHFTTGLSSPSAIANVTNCKRDRSSEKSCCALWRLLGDRGQGHVYSWWIMGTCICICVYTCIHMYLYVFCEPGTGVETIQLLDRG